jgi:hypothetical protein
LSVDQVLAKVRDVLYPKPKTLGEPCSPALKACVDDLLAKGQDEESAWAICKSKIGEAAIKHSNPVEEPEQFTRETVTRYQRDVDNYLCKVDKELAEARVERDLAKTELAELKRNKVTETAGTTKILEMKNAELETWQKRATEAENTLFHVQAKFKGTCKETVKSDTPLYEDPMKTSNRQKK